MRTTLLTLTIVEMVIKEVVIEKHDTPQPECLPGAGGQVAMG